jgi:hypothetical protein
MVDVDFNSSPQPMDTGAVVLPLKDPSKLLTRSNFKATRMKRNISNIPQDTEQVADTTISPGILSVKEAGCAMPPQIP